MVDFTGIDEQSFYADLEAAERVMYRDYAISVRMKNKYRLLNGQEIIRIMDFEEWRENNKLDEDTYWYE